MIGKGFDAATAERDRQLRASKGPGNTFKCGKCGTCKQILGRRKVGKQWHCAVCFAGAV